MSTSLPVESDLAEARAEGTAALAAVSRRGFLRGLGGAVCVGIAGSSLVASAQASPRPVEANQGLPGTAMQLPLQLGAIHHPDCGLGRYWDEAQDFPQCGPYSLHHPGKVDRQMATARQGGLDFLLISFHLDRGEMVTPIINTLYDRADRRPRLAVLIDEDLPARLLRRGLEQGEISPNLYVERQAQRWLERYRQVECCGWLQHESALDVPAATGATAQGARVPVLAFATADAALIQVQILEALRRQAPEVSDLAVWLLDGRSVLGDTGPEMPGVTWMPRNPLRLTGGWDEAAALYAGRASQVVPAVTVSPALRFAADAAGALVPDAGKRLSEQLTAIATWPRRPAFVLVDSFNDWRHATCVEPNKEHGRATLRVLSSWRQRVA